MSLYLSKLSNLFFMLVKSVFDVSVDLSLPVAPFRSGFVAYLDIQPLHFHQYVHTTLENIDSFLCFYPVFE